MEGQYYTHALWRVKTGQEERFVEAWKALAQVFSGLPGSSGRGTLIRSVSDPTLYYSFGSWASLEAIEAMRSDPASRESIQQLRELCEEAVPGTYRVVLEVGG
jgi:heme-degrading monooxygenase HmoA